MINNDKIKIENISEEEAYNIKLFIKGFREQLDLLLNKKDTEIDIESIILNQDTLNWYIKTITELEQLRVKITGENELQLNHFAEKAVKTINNPCDLHNDEDVDTLGVVGSSANNDINDNID